MAPFSEGATSRDAPGKSAAGPYDEVSRVLAGLPRPRTVRMSRRGKILSRVVGIALLGAFAGYFATGIALRREAGRQQNPSSLAPMYAVSIAITAVVAVVMLNTVGTQKRLLGDGELANARVTRRWMARNGPAVRYEFSTPLGEHFSGTASDGSGRLYEGMIVPVFYDPQNPRKQLALSASFYEVVLPDAAQGFGKT